MKKSISILCLSALFAAILYSCSKNKNNSTQNCTLSTLTDSTTSLQSVTQFTYDNSNRLTGIVVTGQNACKRTLQYIGNTIIFTVTDTTPGILNEIDTVVLNNSGFIKTQLRYYPSSGTSSFETYFYDATDTVPAISIESFNGGPADTMEYNTVNGDLMYEKVKGQAINTNEFTYYTSNNIVYGDPTDFRQLLYYGAFYYQNAHMLNVLYSPGTSYKAYTYTFSGNRITQSILRRWKAGSPDTVTHTISYSYSCK